MKASLLHFGDLQIYGICQIFSNGHHLRESLEVEAHILYLEEVKDKNIEVMFIMRQILE